MAYWLVVLTLLGACREPKCPDLRWMDQCIARGGDWDLCAELASAAGATRSCSKIDVRPH